jgi:hypothetical protein
MRIVAAEFEEEARANEALDQVERTIGLALAGREVGRLAPDDGATASKAIAAARVAGDHAARTRAILAQGGGRIVADVDASHAEVTRGR